VWILPTHPVEITKTANEMLRMTFELSKKEAGDGWRRSRSDAIHMLYPSPNVIMS